LRPSQPDRSPPQDADLAWWKQHQKELVFVPTAICNGSECWQYYLRHDWKPGLPAPQSAIAGRTHMVGPADDPTVPWWAYPMAERIAYPLTDPPGHDREFLVEQKPENRTVGTILLRVRDTGLMASGAPDANRLTINPDRTYIATRTEIRMAEAGQPQKTAFIDM